jgi:hypothetical protein
MEHQRMEHHGKGHHLRIKEKEVTESKDVRKDVRHGQVKDGMEGMEMKKHLCDRCGAEILPYRSKGIFVKSGNMSLDLLDEKEYVDVELCRQCFKELKEWLNHAV